MSLKVGELVGFLKIDRSDFDRDVDDAGGRFEGLGGKMLGVAGKAAVGVGLAMAGAAVAGVREFAGLQRGMNEVFTLMPGISAEAMGAMTDDVRKFSRDFGVLPNDVVPALYQSLSAGVPPGNVFEFLETANKAAVGGVTDLETAVDGITSVVNAYGDDVIGAAEASDLMFTAVRLGKTNFEELSASLFNVLPTASALGVGFGDITGAMAVMTAQGVPTSVATTQLRQLMVELSKDGSKASDAFKEVAGVGMAEFMDQGGNMADALDIMKQAADDNGVALQDMFGSVEAGAAALALAGDGTDDYRAALDEMNASAGATEAAHDQMDQGLGRAWERIKATVAVALGELGEAIAPAVQAIADKFIEWMPAIQEVAGAAFGFIGDVVQNVVVPVLQTLGAWWDENGPAIVAVAQDLWAGLQAVFDGIGAAVATVIGWFQANEETANSTFASVRTFAEDVWPKVAGIIQSAVELISTVVRTVMTAVQRFWDNWGQTIMRLVKVAWDTISGLISAALDVIQGVIDLVLGIITGDWDRAWEGIKGIVGGVWNAIKTLVEGAIRTVLTVVSGVLDNIKKAMSDAWNSAKDTAREKWDELKQSISDRIEAVLAFMRELPGRVVSALGDLGQLLRGAGRALMDGLLQGIRDAWESVKEFLGGLAAKIRELKGPLDKDRVLLVAEGQAIMQGLNQGLLDGWRDVEVTLAGLAPQIGPLTVEGAQRGGDGAHLSPADRARGGGVEDGDTINFYGMTVPEAMRAIERRDRSKAARRRLSQRRRP